MVRWMIMKHFELPVKVDVKAMAGVEWRARLSLKEILVATKIAINNNCSLYGASPMCLYYNYNEGKVSVKKPQSWCWFLFVNHISSPHKTVYKRA